MTRPDRLSKDAPGIKILVAHDCDRSGFSIFGTLGKSSRRYDFKNRVEVIDIGLRLEDAEAMGLQAEPAPLGKTSPNAAIETLLRHGATVEEVGFLVDQEMRIELNAMTSPQFIDWLESKLAEHSVGKVIPDEETLEETYRRALVRRNLAVIIAENEGAIEAAAMKADMPECLAEEVAFVLSANPELPWDEAVDIVLRNLSE